MAFFTLTAFTLEKLTATYSSTTTLQPYDERSAQDALPKAQDALWDTLYKTNIKLDDKTGTYVATFPDDVKNLNGQTIKISGFILPLEATEKFKHFLLSKRTPTCFFCPPGEPNEIIEVFAQKPTEWADDLVIYKGQMSLIQGPETGIFFQLKDAVSITSP
jgi:hypothetical protein